MNKPRYLRVRLATDAAKVFASAISGLPMRA